MRRRLRQLPLRRCHRPSWTEDGGFWRTTPFSHRFAPPSPKEEEETNGGQTNHNSSTSVARYFKRNGRYLRALHAIDIRRCPTSVDTQLTEFGSNRLQI